MKYALTAFVLFLAFGLGSSAASARTENHWPAAAEHSFLVNCYRTSGGNVAGCKCELRWLERPERRQQQHVRRHPGRPGQLAHSFGEFAVEDEVVCGPLEGLCRRARPVTSANVRTSQIALRNV